jgi:hypothetical protein
VLRRIALGALPHIRGAGPPWGRSIERQGDSFGSGLPWISSSRGPTESPSPSWGIGTRSSALEKRKTSDSFASSYCGSPLAVFRVMAGREKFDPNPSAPLPEPESYNSES